MAETLAYNFVGNDELSRVFEALDRVAGKLDRTLNQLGDQASQAGRKLGTTGAEAKGASEELDGLGDDAAKAGRKIDELGDDMDKAALKAVVFEAQIRQAKRSVKELTDEFVKTGDVDILKKLGNSQGNLAALEKLKKDLSKTLGEAGAQGGEGFVSNLTKEFTRFAVNPAALGSPLVAGIVLASPVIGAAVGTAVSLGLGAGVLAGGIIAAAQDSRVHDAWSTVINGAKDQFISQSAVLVQPLVDSASIVGSAFSREIPKIGRDLETLAPRITSLATGAAAMMDNIVSGGGNFNRVINLSGELMGTLSSELPNLGNAVSDMLGSVADGGPGIKQFWSDFLVGTEKSVVGVGNLTEALSKTYDFLGGEKSIGKRINDLFNNDIIPGLDKGAHWLDDHIGKPINDFFGQNNRINKPAQDLSKLRDAQDQAATAAAAHERALTRLGIGATLSADDFTKLSQQLNAVSLSNDTLAGQMSDKLLNSMLSMDHATLGFAESQTRLSDSIKQNGLDLDIHTAKGQANRESILSAVQANVAQYDALMRSGAGADEAAKAYDTNTAALEGQLQKAHFTQAEIDGLIGKYRGVPKTVDTNIATYGLSQAIDGLNDTIRLANHLDGRVAVLTIEERHRTTYTNDIPPSQYFKGVATGGMRTAGGIRMAAAGMFIPPSDPGTVLTGEPQTGGEWLIPAQGISPGRAAMLGNAALGNYGLDVVSRSSGYASPVMARGGGTGGAAGMNLTLSASGSGTPFEQSMATWVMYAVRTGLIQLDTENGGKVRVG